jgi:hypothetical protein
MQMKSESVEQFLTARGFNREEQHAGDSEATVSHYYRVVYEVEDVPLCLTNEQPPQLHVTEFHFRTPDGAPDWHSFSVDINNHAPQGWIEFKFYNLSEADLLDGYATIEAAMLAAWRTLFNLDLAQ